MSLAYRNDELVVQVKDNGDLSQQADASQAGGGYGLIGMRERAESLGGEFAACRLPAGGFQVTAILPTPGDGR